MKRAIVAAALLAAAACEKRTAPPRSEPTVGTADAGPAAAAPAAEPIRVPEGCDINLRGKYRLLGRSDFRYQIEDDGERVVITPVAGGDAGVGGEQPSMTLARTPDGFRGQVTGTAKTPAGKQCDVAFRAEIVQCGPRSITVRSEDSVAVGEDCTVERLEGASTDKVLVRE